MKMKSDRANQNSIQQPGRWRIALLLAAITAGAFAQAHGEQGANAEYANFYTGESNTTSKGIEWVQVITVSSPAYCSEIKGDVTVNFSAPGMTKVKVLCWQQPTADNSSQWGHDVEVADLTLNETGNGSFVFHADKFPNGPITLRIHAKDDGKKQDLCQVQLFNQGGVVWNQGMPKTNPPAAKGMKLAFSDDFTGPLSSSGNGVGATYQSHKTGGGDFSGWPFTNNEGALNPYSQVGNFLRIHASKPAGTKGSAGILSSAHEDGGGFYASAPCYFECRFLAQSAPGTWPAFWLLTKGAIGMPKDSPERKEIAGKGTDELDAIEAYGGMGPRNPNFLDYAATSHYWGQKGPDGKQLKAGHVNAPMRTLGGKSSWSTTFHTYGVLITKADTVYYFDDIEVLRHPTGEISKSQPFFFMVNYAIGGISGWHIDLDRYGNQSDMWVDYIRVYQGAK